MPISLTIPEFPPTDNATSRGYGRAWLAVTLLLTLVLGSGCGGLQPPVTGAASGSSDGAGPSSNRSSRGLAVDLPHLELRARLLLLVDRQLYDPFTVEQAFDGDELLRRELARTLARLRDARGVPMLKALLLDPSPTVRREAAFALGRVGDPSARPILQRLLVDSDRAVAREAIASLGRLGASALEVGEALEAAETVDEAELLARLLPELHHFDDPTVPAFARLGLVRGTAPEVVEGAALALARQPVAAAEGELVAMLAAPPSSRSRALAARALGRLGGATALEALRPQLDSEDLNVVIASLEAGAAIVRAGRAAPPLGWREPIGHFLLDSRLGLRAAAVTASSAWLLDEALGNRLVESTDPSSPTYASPWIHGLALQALARGGDPRAADRITAAAAGRDASLRAAAATAASMLDLAEVLTLLREDPSPKVRIAVLEADLTGAAESIETAAPLEEIAAVPRRALADLDGGMQGTALRWLQTYPLLPVGELLAANAGRRRDRLVEVRLAALEALAPRASTVATERAAAVAGLEGLITDPDRRVRSAAARALRTLGETPDPLGPARGGRQVADYEVILMRFARPLRARLETDAGTLTAELLCPQVPLTCLSFSQLVEAGYYDGLTVHRLDPGFVAEAGDPRGDGWGGPGYGVRDEPWPARYHPGSLGLLTTTPDTGGSRFFVTLSEQPTLDGRYTLFGRVVEGMEVLPHLAQGTVIRSVTLESP